MYSQMQRIFIMYLKCHTPYSNSLTVLIKLHRLRHALTHHLQSIRDAQIHNQVCYQWHNDDEDVSNETFIDRCTGVSNLFVNYMRPMPLTLTTNYPTVIFALNLLLDKIIAFVVKVVHYMLASSIALQTLFSNVIDVRTNEQLMITHQQQHTHLPALQVLLPLWYTPGPRAGGVLVDGCVSGLGARSYIVNLPRSTATIEQQ